MKRLNDKAALAIFIAVIAMAVGVFVYALNAIPARWEIFTTSGYVTGVAAFLCAALFVMPFTITLEHLTRED